MDEFEQVAQELANLELQAKDIVRQMAKNLCVDLTVTEECEPKQLVSPTDLQRRWMITAAEYDELLAEGLPTIQFASGVVRHPEAAVDEFFRKMADRNHGKPPELVGSPYIAERLGCTTYWVTQMVRRGEIPSSHVVPGTGSGKPWKFYRVRVDAWLKRR